LAPLVPFFLPFPCFKTVGFSSSKSPARKKKKMTRPGGWFREHSGNIHGTISEHSGNIRSEEKMTWPGGWLREHSGNIQRREDDPAGWVVQGTISEQSVNIQ
jgi:hypothetical protein